MHVNDAIVRTLESAGVDHMFGGSGKVNASMLIGLKHSDQIRTVMVKNEQAASFMACGYAMFSDKLGVCFSTGGPGEFNLFSGMAVALSDSLPVLALSGYAPKSFRGKGCLNESSGLNRTPDSFAMFSATTKKSFIIDDPADTCDILEEAINLALAGRPGPVHVHTPMDVVEADIPNFRQVSVSVPATTATGAEVAELARLLSEAVAGGKTLLAWIGYGAIRSHAEKELLELVERLQLPFVTTMDGKGVLPEDHALSLGVIGHNGDPGAKAYFDRADLVLAVGNSFAQDSCYAFRRDLFDGKTLIHINIDPNEIGKVYAPTLGIVSDVKAALVALAALPLTDRPTPAQQVDKVKWHSTPFSAGSGAIHPAALTLELNRLLPPETIVLGDAGAHMLWLNAYLELKNGQVYQNPGSFGPMSSHVNGSLGVKCANPNRPVVVGCGDGAYLMGGFELLTAVEYDIPVVWVVFNNGELNVVKEFQHAHGDEAFVAFRNPDYVRYAEACGAQGFRVDDLADFAPAFTSALASGRPTLIDVAVDADVYPPYARELDDPTGGSFG